MPGTSEQVLRRVAAATKGQLAAYKEGVYLTSTSGLSFEDLRHEVTANRMKFANQFLVTGEKLMKTRPPQYRSAISRYYYCMYHTLRAVAFFVYEGDDHESHKDLPAHVPRDFPDAAVWGNALKSARENRNAADYDPYASVHASWQSIAKDLSQQAPSLLTISTGFLKSKGCNHL